MPYLFTTSKEATITPGYMPYMWQASKGGKMTIKTELDKGTVFATIQQYIDCGATVEQAIEKAEGILRVQLPEHIKSLIRREAMSRK